MKVNLTYCFVEKNIFNISSFLQVGFFYLKITIQNCVIDINKNKFLIFSV